MPQTAALHPLTVSVRFRPRPFEFRNREDEAADLESLMREARKRQGAEQSPGQPCEASQDKKPNHADKQVADRCRWVGGPSEDHQC